jgi:uncharacterized membrane protein YiaA
MRFSLLKAIRNTHRHPANRVLHAIGLSFYIIAILIILDGLFNKDINPFILILFAVAIALFLLGHAIEGNLRATTWVIIFKYLKANMNNRIKIIRQKKT